MKANTKLLKISKRENRYTERELSTIRDVLDHRWRHSYTIRVAHSVIHCKMLYYTYKLINFHKFIFSY